MSDDVTQDYAEMLGVLTAAGLQAGFRASRDVVRDAEKLRKRLQRAVKGPDWAPKDKAEWDTHTEIKNPEGKTIGYADRSDPLVATLDGEKGPDKAPGRAQMLNVAGALWLAVNKGGDHTKLDTASPTSSSQAHEWLSEQGWTVLNEQQQWPASTLGDRLPEVNPAAVGEIRGPVLVESGSVQVPAGATEVVATGGEVAVDEATPVQVSGEATVNGAQVSGWDDFADQMSQQDAPVPDLGPSAEEERMIAPAPTTQQPQSAGLSR